MAKVRVMGCRGVFDALTRSESSVLCLKDKRAGLEMARSASATASNGDNKNFIQMAPQPSSVGGYDDEVQCFNDGDLAVFHFEGKLAPGL